MGEMYVEELSAKEVWLKSREDPNNEFKHQFLYSIQASVTRK